MKTKYQKVNLKSDIFKIDKTPQKQYLSKSKSPLAKSHIHRTPPPSKISQPLSDPSDLFQRVCCPNCRYLFKIIKNNDVFNIKKIVNEWTQTDNYQRKANVCPAAREESLNISFNVISAKTDITSNISPQKTSQKKNSSRSSTKNIEETNYINKNTYKLQELSLPQNKINQKNYLDSNQKSTSTSKLVSNLLKKQSCQPSKLITQRQKRTRGTQEKAHLLDKQINQQSLNQNKVYTIELDVRCTQDLKLALMKNYESILMDVEMRQFFKEIPESIELAGYRKMLFYDYKHSEIQTE